MPLTRLVHTFGARVRAHIPYLDDDVQIFLCNALPSRDQRDEVICKPVNVSNEPH